MGNITYKKILFKNALEDFKKHMDNVGKATITVQMYGYRLNEMITYLEKVKNSMLYLSDVKISDLESFIYYLKEKGNSGVSRNKAVYIIRSFYKYCYRKNLVDRNIGEELDAVAFEQKERLYLSSEEVEKLLISIKSPLMKLVAITLANTGMRIGECLNLTIDDVKLEDSVILIRNTKSKRERIVPINEDLLPLLKAYKKNWRECKNSNYFFGTKLHGKLTQHGVNKALHQTTTALGWSKKVTCHTLRHSFASTLCKKKVELPTIQRLLGHSNLGITGIYLHSNLDDLKTAVNCL